MSALVHAYGCSWLLRLPWGSELEIIKFKLKIDGSVKTPRLEYGVGSGSWSLAPIYGYFTFFRKRKCPIDRQALGEHSAKVSIFVLHFD